MKIINNPARKEYSASVPYSSARFDLLRIERNESKQLIMKITKHTAVILSIKVVAVKLKTFIEVNTTKQNPSKLEAEPNICGGISCFSLIRLIY